MIKKLILVLYAAVLMLYMTACAAPKPAEQEESEEDVGFVEDTEEDVEEAAEDMSDEAATDEAPAAEEAMAE